MSLLDHAPTFSCEEAVQIAHDLFGIQESAEPPSQRTRSEFPPANRCRSAYCPQDRQCDRRTGAARSAKPGDGLSGRSNLVLPACFAVRKWRADCNGDLPRRQSSFRPGGDVSARHTCWTSQAPFRRITCSIWGIKLVNSLLHWSASTTRRCTATFIGISPTAYKSSGNRRASSRMRNCAKRSLNWQRASKKTPFPYYRTYARASSTTTPTITTCWPAAETTPTLKIKPSSG